MIVGVDVRKWRGSVALTVFSSHESARRRPPAAAIRLGYAGLAPFVAAAALSWTPDPDLRNAAAVALMLYGGLILSFMGGCRWGFAAGGLGAGPTLRALAVSVAPSLWAFALLGATMTAPATLPAWAGCLGLAIGFAVLWASDVAAAKSGDAPDWWPALRGPLTLGACAALVVGGARLASL